jgi:hypothetical protein
MRCLAAAIFLLSTATLHGGGPDDVALWRFGFPGLGRHKFSQEPFSVCARGLTAIAIYAEPYGISSLRWNHAGFKYGFGKWGFDGHFQSYGLTQLYAENTVALGAAFIPHGSLAVSAAIRYAMQTFDHLISYSGIYMDLGVSCKLRDFTGMLVLNRITLKKPYDFPEADRPEPAVSLSIKPDSNLVLSAGFKRTSRGRNRWFIEQSLNIVKDFELHLGYMTAPSILTGGLDISWRRFTLLLTYGAVSRLNDSVVLGLSFGT